MMATREKTTAKTQRFIITLYKNGDHMTRAKTVGINAVLADVPMIVESWRGHEDICCWDAMSHDEEIVAGRSCRA